MNTTTAAVVMVAVLVAVLAVVHVPFGDYMARVYSSRRHLRVERGIYRLVGVDPDREQTWGVYARSVLAFSAVSVLFLYLSSGCRRTCRSTSASAGYRRRWPSTPPRRS